MQIVEIVADRFAVASDRRAIDLATGALVVLKVGVGGGAAEQRRWSIRCDGLHKMRHPRLAALIDYGGLGESQRFEAWQCGPSWRGTPEKAARTLHATSQYLRACGLTDGGDTAADVHDFDGRAVIVPSEQAGYLRDPAASTEHAKTSGLLEVLEALSLDNCGICTIDRRADAVLADLFASLGGSRPHIVSIWGPPGSGRTTAALHAARVARLNGFVPIGVRILSQIDGGLVKDRHLCVISDDETGIRWATFLSATLASPRVHVLLWIGRDELPGVHGVGLDRIPPDTLAGAVRPMGLDGRTVEQIKRAAAVARGLPARFTELLWRDRMGRVDGARRCRTGGPLRVAEQPSVYGVEEAQPPCVERSTWPAPSELAALRRRSEAAVELLKKGRHEPGLRQLRQAIGSLSRRGDWAHVNDALLTLASTLLARGEARGALAALDEARACGERTSNEAALIDAAVLSGHARIDLAQLDEAESVIGTAVAVARRIGDASRGLFASLALGRCLFWKGQYADARSALAKPTGNAVGSHLTVPMMAAAARAAVGMRDVSGALSLVREATDEASRCGDPSLIARASCAAAFVHLAIGDVDAVAADVGACIAAARAARDPMRAIRARLLRAESDRRRGRMSSSASFIRRVRGMGSMHLPPIIRSRADLVQTLAEATASPADTAARHASRSGLVALSLYVAPTSREQDPRPLTDSSAEGLVSILHLCQTAEDEGRVLANVCARLRKELHAASAAVFVGDERGVSLIAADGARLEAAIAARAVTTGITIAPHLLHDRLESAAPVRYGGSVIGALAARWPLGTPYDLSRVAAVLTMAATAAAPVVSGAIERRARPSAPAMADLLGLTAAMSELRRAVERAAPAPFAVLIEGESGSGKELVAKAIHRSGLRRDRPFCTLNCAALPDDLIEAELFGHARGAFTGAVNERAGVFEEAHGGTLFLDEVGELSARAQAKLLRVIQEGELRRIGENLSRRVDVRIISATNRDLRQEVAAGRFRLDLLYRLDVIRLVVPPLRDRREDIAVLADHFWRETAARIGSRAILGATTTAALACYNWPGNVRELQNVLAALAVRTPRRGVVPPEALPPQFGESRTAEALRLDDARRTFEERFVRAALVRTGGHRGRAATELGVTRQGLTKLMTRLGIADR